MAKIDRQLLFKYLDQLFGWPPTTDEQAPLNAVITYWDKNFDDEDERLLAHILAKVHHRSQEAAKRAKAAGQADARPPIPAPAELKKDFSSAKEDVWSQVSEITPDDPNTDAASRFSNMFYTALAKIHPLPLVQVLSEELRQIRPGASESHESLQKVFKDLYDQELTALCFSGGGIRSATFGLGIVQALAHHGLLGKFDYLSTVSGGGYLGSWLSAWIRRERVRRAAKFKATSTTSKLEIERSSDIGVLGLSDVQIVTLELLGDSSSIKSISDLRDAAKTITPKDKATLTASQQAVLQQLASGDGDVEGLTVGQFEVLRKLSPEERATLLNDPTFYNAGVHSVAEQINCVDIESRDRPTPEPVQLRHLREYSNYMSPKTGMLSADTWALIAIYLRNLFLNLTIFVPLIAAVLMLPRFLFLAIVQKDIGHGLKDSVKFWTLAAAIIVGSLAFAYVISRLPSKRRPKADSNEKPKTWWPKVKAFLNTEAGVLTAGVIPLVISAYMAACVWAWNYRSSGKLFESSALNFLPFLEGQTGLSFFLVAAAAAFGMGLLLYGAFNKFHNLGVWEVLFTLLATVLGGAILWLAAQKFFNPIEWSRALGPRFEQYEWQVYLSLSVPAFLLIALLAASVYVGLTSTKSTDEDREWLARFGGWVLIVSCAWAVVNVLVLLGPSLLQWLFRGLTSGSQIDWSKVFSSSGIPAILSVLAAIASGVVSLAGGFSEKSVVSGRPAKSKKSSFLSFALQIAAVVFLASILICLAFLTTVLVYGTGAMADPELNHVAVLNRSYAIGLLVMFLVLAGVGIFMAFFINVNKFSLHGAYRDRLTRAYLGASNPERNQQTFTGFDDSDNLELHNLENQRPFHIINATVNLVGGKNLAWQNRKAASFTMSPLHCGSWAVRGFRRSKDYCINFTSKKALRLGTAMAISGAAANPNMGYFSSPVITFLMSLFNIRLGWWLGNTGPAGSDFHWFGKGNYRFFEKVGPSVAVFPLINETLGRTDENKRFLMVTDGGHFENLALYEMILRRCRLIVLSDGAADQAFKFGEISNAIQKCKVDLGVDIKFERGINIVARDVDDDGRKDAVRYAIAEITYPEKDNGKNLTGMLLYTRPAYYDDDEYTDIKHYADANPAFPHQSTGDQMYDEKQFEAYRKLGFFTMDQIIKSDRDRDLQTLITFLERG